MGKVIHKVNAVSPAARKIPAGSLLEMELKFIDPLYSYFVKILTCVGVTFTQKVLHKDSQLKY